MSAPHADQLIAGYLARLREASEGLPEGQRRELIADISAHVAEARHQLDHETDAGVLNILDRLGDPSVVAAEAADRLGTLRPPAAQPAVARPGLVEIGALVLTPLFWPIGVILLWASSAWNTRDKLIGSLLPPGGYLGLGFFLAYSAGSVHACSVTGSCGTGPPWWLETLVTSLVLVSPLLPMVYLAIRLRANRSLRAT
jgi:hypothetical protein